MKTSITIENEGLRFLQGILSTTPALNTADSRKQNAAFATMRPHIDQYRLDLRNVDESFRVYEPMKDDKGNMTEGFKIPREKKEEYEKAAVEVDKKKVTVDFEIESFTTLKAAYNGLFQRKDTKEAGLNGEDTMRWIDQIETAFEHAVQK